MKKRRISPSSAPMGRQGQEQAPISAGNVLVGAQEKLAGHKASAAASQGTLPANLFHKSRFRQTSVSALVPASGQGDWLRCTPKEPPSLKLSWLPVLKECKVSRKRIHQGNIFRTLIWLLQDKPAKPQVAKHSYSWADRPSKHEDTDATPSFEVSVLTKTFPSISA